MSLLADPPSPFVVGVPRSGTTLVRLMLDAHPTLAVPPETHFLPRLLRLQGTGDNLRTRFLSTIVTTDRWPDLHITVDELDQALRAERPSSVSDAIRVVYRTYAARLGKFRWGDKTPRYLHHMLRIAHALPEARFVHIIRDGRDVAVSSRNLWFGPGTDMRGQGTRWADSISLAREQAQRVSHYLEIRYEDLVHEPERTLRAVCAFIELPYSDSMLDYHTTSRGRLEELTDIPGTDGETVSGSERRGLHERVTHPPDSHRVGRWLRELSRRELQEFEGEAGELLEELGYDTMT